MSQSFPGTHASRLHSSHACLRVCMWKGGKRGGLGLGVRVCVCVKVCVCAHVSLPVISMLSVIIPQRFQVALGQGSGASSLDCGDASIHCKVYFFCRRQ